MLTVCRAASVFNVKLKEVQVCFKMQKLQVCLPVKIGARSSDNQTLALLQVTRQAVDATCLQSNMITAI